MQHDMEKQPTALGTVRREKEVRIRRGPVSWAFCG